jgi:hypothetical protein
MPASPANAADNDADTPFYSHFFGSNSQRLIIQEGTFDK